MPRPHPVRVRSRTIRCRPLASLVAAVLALAVSAGCGGQPTGGTGPLRVGASLSLTGSLADTGRAAQRGYQAWADTANASGGVLGRHVELTIRDDGSNVDRVRTNYQDLIFNEHVDLLLGPVSTLLTVPASQVAAAQHYAFIEPAGGGPAVFAQHLYNLFFVQPAPVIQQGTVFARYILSLPADQRPTTAAYPCLDDPYAVPIVDEVRRLFEAAGIRTVYAKTYPIDTSDTYPVMAEVAATRPDVIVAGTQYADGYSDVRALVKLNWGPRWLYLSNGANAPVAFPDAVGAANTNAIFTSSDWSPNSAASGNSSFVGAYLNRYGGSASDIDNTSAEAYSAGLLISQVAARTGKVDNATIVETLHTGVWRTPVGDLSWDDSGSPRGSFTLQQWIDGKLCTVYPAGQADHQPVTTPLAWMR